MPIIAIRYSIEIIDIFFLPPRRSPGRVRGVPGKIDAVPFLCPRATSLSTRCFHFPIGPK